MSTFTNATLLKAVVAAVAAAITSAVATAGGPDIAALTLDQWLLTIGPALAAAIALFHTPTKVGEPKAAVSVQPVPAPAPLNPADVVAAVINNHQSLASSAVDSIKAVQSAVTGLTDLLPKPVQQTLAPEIAVEKTVAGVGELGAEVLSPGGLANAAINIAKGLV